MKLYKNCFVSYKKSYDERILNEKEERYPKQFKLVHHELSEWLDSKNDFKEAKRLIDGIRIEMNKVKVSKEDNKAFNDLNRLITDISNMVKSG